jgi:rare lipoprotein A
VTNLANGRSVVVRINDRGPFKRDRLIDVSATVAELLGFERAGTTEVKVDYVGPARMDGRDRKQLMASYRAPKSGTRADTPKLAKAVDSPRVVLAAAAESLAAARAGAGGAGAIVPIRLTPASSQADLAQGFVPTGKGRPGLAPLALRTSFASSYAPDGDISEAEAAAARLARASKRTAAGARIVQLGAFADATNAARVADAFRRFGRVEITDRAVEGRALHSVRVFVEDQKIDPAAVIATADAAGLHGARLTAN